jgi:hypothetical protein
LRRSAGLLRWMSPDEDLQPMRRRVHMLLVQHADAGAEASTGQQSGVLTYAIHCDAADAPFAKFVQRVFLGEGHRRVADSADPQHHIAILSNRSSQAWVQQVTKSYAGRLVFIVTSTIEFKDTLTETARYQWVDARDGSRQDIIGLARSLADAQANKRAAALETTPAMIDTWKVPPGINLLKWLLYAVAGFLLVFGGTDLAGFVIECFGIDLKGTGNSGLSVVRVVIGITYFWIVSRSLVYRKIPALVLYSGLAVTFAIAVWLFAYPTPEQLKAESVTIWTSFWYVLPTLITVLTIYAAVTSHSWLPGIARINADEVGIRKSIARNFRRWNLILVTVLVVGIIISVLAKIGCDEKSAWSSKTPVVETGAEQ